MRHLPVILAALAIDASCQRALYTGEASASTPGARVVRLEILSGALVQPTSTYLHKISGAAIYVPVINERGFIQARIIARPEHRSAGYGSSDRLWSLTAGAATPLLGGAFHSGLGFGNASGYSRKLSTPSASTDSLSSGYNESTFNVTLGYSLTILGFISLGLRHETAIAVGDERQRKAFVTWPFQTYSFALGVSI